MIDLNICNSFSINIFGCLSMKFALVQYGTHWTIDWFSSWIYSQWTNYFSWTLHWEWIIPEKSMTHVPLKVWNKHSPPSSRVDCYKDWYGVWKSSKELLNFRNFEKSISIFHVCSLPNIFVCQLPEPNNEQNVWIFFGRYTYWVISTFIEEVY